MENSRQFLKELGYPERDLYDLPSSTKRFPDGAQYRLEIPSVEGPNALKAVVDEMKKLRVPIHRVSQGSGIMMLSDEEIKEMCQIANEERMELSLFTGPRGTFDISAQPLTPTGKNTGVRHEGIDQLVYAMEDLQRGADLGVRGALIGDEGLMMLTKEMKRKGLLPQDFVVKASVQIMASNPVSVKLMAELGADTYNVPTALTLPKLAAIRQVIDIPIDLYVEVPDNLGGFVRHYEIPEFIRVLAPVYLKFGLRNHPDVYPSGLHLEKYNEDLGRERVRRAAHGMRIIQKYCPEAIMSEKGAADLGIPVVK